jgi:hypothetical protein
MEPKKICKAVALEYGGCFAFMTLGKKETGPGGGPALPAISRSVKRLIFYAIF